MVPLALVTTISNIPFCGDKHQNRVRGGARGSNRSNDRAHDRGDHVSDLTHLQRLEAESIHILREAVSEADGSVTGVAAGVGVGLSDCTAGAAQLSFTQNVLLFVPCAPTACHSSR